MSSQSLLAAVAEATTPTAPPVVTIVAAPPPAAPAAPPLDAAALRAEGAKAERDRLGTIDALALPGFDEMAAKAKAEGTAPADFAVAQIAALKASKRLDALDAMRTGAATVPAIEPTASDPLAAVAPAPALAGEARWKAEYAASPALQKEFGGEAGYLAFRRADTSGRIR
jgi:hypothetical protein